MLIFRGLLMITRKKVMVCDHFVNWFNYSSRCILNVFYKKSISRHFFLIAYCLETDDIMIKLSGKKHAHWENLPKFYFRRISHKTHTHTHISVSSKLYVVLFVYIHIYILLSLIHWCCWGVRCCCSGDGCCCYRRVIAR